MIPHQDKINEEIEGLPQRCILGIANHEGNCPVSTQIPSALPLEKKQISYIPCPCTLLSFLKEVQEVNSVV